MLTQSLAQRVSVGRSFLPRSGTWPWRRSAHAVSAGGARRRAVLLHVELGRGAARLAGSSSSRVAASHTTSASASSPSAVAQPSASRAVIHASRAVTPPGTRTRMVGRRGPPSTRSTRPGPLFANSTSSWSPRQLCGPGGTRSTTSVPPGKPMLQARSPFGYSTSKIIATKALLRTRGSATNRAWDSAYVSHLLVRTASETGFLSVRG